MEADRHTTRPAGPETCPSCARPFVVPVALLDLLDEGLYLLALECKDCGHLAVGEVEDAELEQLEAAYDRAVAEMAGALEIVALSRFIDDLTSFHYAVEQDAVLPEDF